MATEDGKIIINPYSGLSDAEKRAVAQNEGLRLWMREHDFAPDFAVTPAQREAFKNTEYGKPENETFLKQTIVARILTGDKSAGAYTKEQAAWADKLRRMISQQ